MSIDNGLGPVEKTPLSGIQLVAQELKNSGFKISSTHYRLVNMQYKVVGSRDTAIVPVPMPLHEVKRQNLQDKINSNGGYTTVRIKNKNGSIDFTGVSKCHENDNFNNKLGYKKAFYMALSQLPEEYRPLSALTAKE